MRPIRLAIAAIAGAVETMGAGAIAIRYVDDRNMR
jgi:hypothetical protein